MNNFEENLSTSVPTGEEMRNAVKDSYGVLYTSDGKRLLKCENKDLRQYVINGNTKVICDHAFEECENLSEIIIPEGVTKIGVGAFMYCKHLHKIDIPNGVIRIGINAFNACKYLEEVTIPASVNTIENQAFADCRNMEKLVCLNPVPPVINNSVFFCVPANMSTWICVLYVPKGSKNAFSWARGWSEFERIEELE